MVAELASLLAEFALALFWAATEFALFLLAVSLCLRGYTRWLAFKEGDEAAVSAARRSAQRWMRLTWGAAVGVASAASALGLAWVLIVALT